MTAVQFALALPWLLFALLVPVVLQRRPRLRTRATPPRTGQPLVSIVVPARNEAENISACLATLLATAYPDREIIVVDDGSVDGTADIVRILAARADSRLRFIEGEPLPAGWLGKCWACWQGYRAARGDLIAFTDADTRHDDDLLGHAVGALDRDGVGLVSVMPRLLLENFWDRLVLPHIFIVLALRYGDLRRMQRTRNPRDVIANGHFMLFRREVYERAGGHQAVRHSVIEDVALAQRVVASGGRVVLAVGEELLDARMYRSLPAVVEGWSKTLASACRLAVAPRLRPIVPWLVGLALIAFWSVPPILFLVSLFTGIGDNAAGWAIITTLVSIPFWMLVNLRLRIPAHHALLYPAGAIVAGFLFLRSALRGRRVKWRGRTYDLQPAGPDRD
jgi:chlorobactene glucosyltransferase